MVQKSFLLFHETLSLLITTVKLLKHYWNYSQREEELLSSWWKEFAECSVGPRGQLSIDTKSGLQTRNSSPESASSGELYETEKERVGVPVKGGLYEVPIYSS